MRALLWQLREDVGFNQAGTPDSHILTDIGQREGPGHPYSTV